MFRGFAVFLLNSFILVYSTKFFKIIHPRFL